MKWLLNLYNDMADMNKTVDTWLHYPFEAAWHLLLEMHCSPQPVGGTFWNWFISGCSDSPLSAPAETNWLKTRQG